MADIKSLLLQVFSIIGCQSTEEIKTENELLRIQSIVREVFDKSVVEGVVTCGSTQIDEFAELQMPKVQVLSRGSSDLRPIRSSPFQGLSADHNNTLSKSQSSSQIQSATSSKTTNVQSANVVNQKDIGVVAQKKEPLTDAEKLSQFRSCMENKQEPVNVQLNSLVSKQIAINREILKIILEGVITCGQQNLGLRGHRDDAKHCLVESNNPDEAADISNVEQMAMVLRFVDSNSHIREEFLGFVPCVNGLSGASIAKTIEDGILSMGLDMQYCRGQGYDGAGNMAGKCSGAAIRIQQTYQKAKLIDVCRTRWVARIDGLDVFIQIFAAVVAALEAIQDNADKSWSPESMRDASSLVLSITSFGFILSLVVVSRCLEVTRPLTKQLQTPTMDVVKCQEKIALLFTMLNKMRRDIINYHEVWYREAEKIALSFGTVPNKPRIASKQIHRNNMPSDTVTEYYRLSFSVPFLDHLINQISVRFSDRNIAAFDGFYAVPSNVLAHPDWKSKFEAYLSFYIDDLPEPRFLQTELAMWEETWKGHKQTPPSSLESLMPMIDKLTFPNIYVAMQILATLPVTSCSCERSFSVLRRLKTYLRSTMAEERLNSLALLYVHRAVHIDRDKVIDIFARMHPRRMKLLDILNAEPL
eukprot:gene16928-biopygen6032